MEEKNLCRLKQTVFGMISACSGQRQGKGFREHDNEPCNSRINLTNISYSRWSPLCSYLAFSQADCVVYAGSLSCGCWSDGSHGHISQDSFYLNQELLRTGDQSLALRALNISVCFCTRELVAVSRSERESKKFGSLYCANDTNESQTRKPTAYFIQNACKDVGIFYYFL